jgi:hypothetical protein
MPLSLYIKRVFVLRQQSWFKELDALGDDITALQSCFGKNGEFSKLFDTLP